MSLCPYPPAPAWPRQGGQALKAHPVQLLQEEQQQPGFWTFSYYQSFFDVDTSQVRSGKLVGGGCHAWGSATLHGARPVLWALGRLEIHTLASGSNWWL